MDPHVSNPRQTGTSEYTLLSPLLLCPSTTISQFKLSEYPLQSCLLLCPSTRDDNLSTGIWSNGYGYEDDFLPVGGTCTRPESRRIWNEYFFPPAGNPTGTRYFTAAIILRCEQVKMCSFCYINYDLFWLLNFTIRLSQIFVEY
jgi:hypothetical protein